MDKCIDSFPHFSAVKERKNGTDYLLVTLKNQMKASYINQWNKKILDYDILIVNSQRSEQIIDFAIIFVISRGLRVEKFFEMRSFSYVDFVLELRRKHLNWNLLQQHHCDIMMFQCHHNLLYSHCSLYLRILLAILFAVLVGNNKTHLLTRKTKNK